MRQIRFRVESNRAKNRFWYTLVSGNGNTTMTSKSSYSDHDVAKRAAIRQIRALQSAPLALEYTTASGRVVTESVGDDGESRVAWENLPPELMSTPESSERVCSSHGR